MKVLMFIDTIGRHGGAESQFIGLAQLLKSNSYSVEILTYHPDEGYLTELERYNIPVHIVNLGKSKISKIFRARKIINIINPDLVIGFKDGANAIASCLKMGGAKWKLIVGERSTTQSRNIYTDLKFFSYRFADLIIPNSNSQKNFIKKHYPRLLSKVTVITNFTDLDKFKPPIIKKRNDILKIIVVGRISPEKNTIFFLRAISKVRSRLNRPFIVDWYGYTTDKQYMILCNEEINNLGLKNYFHIHQPVENINEIYRSYDISCLPSLYEGFPNAICESMSSGLPILASNVCDNSYLVTNNYNGYLFDPNSVDNMAEVIEKMISLSTDKLELMGNNSRKEAEQLLSSDNFVFRYKVLINSLL